MSSVDLEEELAGFFAGEHEGAMGLRSWLGRWQDDGPTRGGVSSASPPDPGGAALAAARQMNLIEYALRRCGDHARILAARFMPRGPFAPLNAYGELAGVVLLLEREVRQALDEAVERELRVALRSDRVEHARELLDSALPETLLARLQALDLAAAGPARDRARRARVVRTAIKAMAGAAVRRSLERYREARSEARSHQRADRLRRSAGSLSE